MEKKTLNLDFVELERLEGNTDVCLMPCPCSGSEPSYTTASYQGTGAGFCVGIGKEAAQRIALPVIEALIAIYGQKVIETIHKGPTDMGIDYGGMSDSEAMAASVAQGVAMEAAAAAGGGGK